MLLMEMLPGLTQFGAAGLMGALWVWERRLSRHREAQLDEAHQQLMRAQQELRVLVKLVRRNTQAIERFEQTQRQLKDLLERIGDESKRQAA
ncbi:MAG TPA: hypothetical protein VF184_03975 [Phycisphaeraceae bacterium]